MISNRAQAGALERARRAGVPTVMLRDPGDAAELLAALGDAQLVVLDHCGHRPEIEQADEFVRVVREFLQD